MSISSDILEHLQKRAAESDAPNSWGCYAALLQYVSGALGRVPELAALEACNNSDSDLILERELEHLAVTVAEVFPGRGPEELVYYLKT